jgi:hypothetical protein
VPSLSGLTPKKFDALCTGCGECCSITTSGIACPALDTATRQCSNYENRLTQQRCVKLTPEIVPDFHERGFLPDDCSYVRYMNDEQPYKLPLDQIKTRRLIPFGLAPRDIKKKYWKAEKKWLSTNPRPETYE